MGGVIAYSAGNQSSYAAKSNGKVWAWGDNSSGELGPGGGRLKRSPTPIAMLGLCSSCGAVVQLASGQNSAFALFANGSVQAWGSDLNGALGNGDAEGGETPSDVLLPGPAVAISAGAQHGVALEADGTVWTWGENNYGQLGTGTRANSTAPVKVTGISGAISVTAAKVFTMALLSNGSVQAWGSNKWGQLGDGTTTNRFTPVKVVGLPQPVVGIPAGGNFRRNGHSLALLRDGTAMAWGLNSSGELGNGSTQKSNVPVHVMTISGVAQVAAGGTYSVARLADGEVWTWGDDQVWTWGDDQVGELGTGDPLQSSSVPVQVPGLDGVTVLSAGPPGQVLAYGP